MSTITCPNCHTAHQSRARYCTQCGHKLPEPLPAPTTFEDGRQMMADALVLGRVTETLEFLDTRLKHAADSELRHQIAQGAKGAVSALQGVFKQAQKAARAVESQLAPAPGAPPEELRPCLRCGAKLRPRTKFCATCGAPTDIAPTGIPLTFSIGSETAVGKKREHNEDTVRVWRIPTTADTIIPVCLVADGMGGAAAGELASSIVVDTVLEQLHAATERGGFGDVAEFLAAALREANQRVFQRAQSDLTLRGMGSTATAALLRGQKAYFAQVGDSRAYLIDAQGTIRQITRDHSLVATLVEIGQITPKEAETHPQRSALYRSIGVSPRVEVDTFTRLLLPGDRVLLCSDGLIIHTNDAELADAVMRYEPEEACQHLVALANGRGGDDNISVIVVRVDSGSGR